MKKRNFFLIGAAALLAFAACIDKDVYNPEYANEVRQSQYAKAFKQVFGEIDPNHDWGFGTSRSADLTSRSFTSSSTAPGNIASAAQGVVNPYSPVPAPAVPGDAIDLDPINPYYGPNGPTFLESGKNYVISSGDFRCDVQKKFADSDKDGTINVYIAPGVTLNGNPNIEYGSARVKYYICEGATWKCTTNPLEIHNWGTLNLSNGLSQPAPGSDGMVVGYDSNGQQIKSNATQKLFNYKTLIVPEDQSIQIEGEMYSSKDVDAVISSGSGSVYIDGNFKAKDGFGLAGELYVSGTMSGDININRGLVAHVGSISTTGAVVVTAGSQLVVEGDVTAPSMKLDGDNGGAVEVVVKGKADISGNVDIASGTKGYFEQLKCANYTANASDVWVGCSLSLGINGVGGKFELNGNSNFTLAAGAYLGAKEANFAADTKMTMMSGAFFNVEGKLQLNSANTNNIHGDGENLSVVKANKLGANYEDFSKTFTGNIGVDFEAWDYKTSTGKINENVNLKKLSADADITTIPETGCSPGFTGDKVKSTSYTVKYLDKDTNTRLQPDETGSGTVGSEFTGEYPTSIVYEGQTYTYDSAAPTDATITLVEDATQNVIIFYYKKNETTTTTPDPDSDIESSYRVFAEDLGSIGDFDFNDVVFDVINYKNGTAELVLRAAGGTLPLHLKIPEIGWSVEVHAAFVVNTNEMVNTKNGTLERAPKTFNFTRKIDPAEVEIWVTYNSQETPEEICAPIGEAPGKFCLQGTNHPWTNERQQIGALYSDFKLWVGDQDYEWWKKVVVQ